MESIRQGNKEMYDQIGTEMRYNMTSHWIIHQDKKTYVLDMCTPSLLGVKNCQTGIYTKCSKHITQNRA